MSSYAEGPIRTCSSVGQNRSNRSCLFRCEVDSLGACRDCKNCTNSALAHAGRKLGRWSIALYTLGVSEMVMATRKKCRGCGHQMSLHGVDQVGSAPQPTVQVQS